MASAFVARARRRLGAMVAESDEHHIHRTGSSHWAGGQQWEGRNGAGSSNVTAGTCKGCGGAVFQYLCEAQLG